MKKKTAKPGLEALEDRCVPATFTWQGTSSTDWHTADNWSKTANAGTRTLPGTTDKVVLQIGAGGRMPVTNSAVTIRELTMLWNQVGDADALTVGANFTVDHLGGSDAGDTVGPSKLERGKVVVNGSNTFRLMRHTTTGSDVVLGNTIEGNGEGTQKFHVDSVLAQTGVSFKMKDIDEFRIDYDAPGTTKSTFTVKDTGNLGSGGITVEGTDPFRGYIHQGNLVFERPQNVLGTRAHFKGQSATADNYFYVEGGTLKFESALLESNYTLFQPRLIQNGGTVLLDEHANVEFQFGVSTNFAVDQNGGTFKLVGACDVKTPNSAATYGSRFAGTLEFSVDQDFRTARFYHDVLVENGTFRFVGDGRAGRLQVRRLEFAVGGSVQMRGQRIAGAPESDRIVVDNDVKSTVNTMTLQLTLATAGAAKPEVNDVFDLLHWGGTWQSGAGLYSAEDTFALQTTAGFGLAEQTDSTGTPKKYQAKVTAAPGGGT